MLVHREQDWHPLKHGSGSGWVPSGTLPSWTCPSFLIKSKKKKKCLDHSTVWSTRQRRGRKGRQLGVEEDKALRGISATLQSQGKWNQNPAWSTPTVAWKELTPNTHTYSFTLSSPISHPPSLPPLSPSATRECVLIKNNCTYTLPTPWLKTLT